MKLKLNVLIKTSTKMLSECVNSFVICNELYYRTLLLPHKELFNSGQQNKQISQSLTLMAIFTYEKEQKKLTDVSEYHL